MRRTLGIISHSLVMALQELWKNKLRTFLSLFGVTIGIFCIIGVLATVNSLQVNIQNRLKDLGNNTIYVDKWDWKGGPDYPWWKYAKRPAPRIDELEQIRARSHQAQYLSFFINTSDAVEYGNNSISGVKLYGVTQQYPSIQPLDIEHGRALNEAEYVQGTNTLIMGFEVAEKLFGDAMLAVGKDVTIRGRKCRVVGTIKKQGSQMFGGWQFDKSIVTSYRFLRTVVDENRANPIIMVKAYEGITSKTLKDELTGVMRSVHKLKPAQENDFALNDINDFSESMNDAFASINIGGWAIGILSFIVGIFGVANIMFVTVKERTMQIGLKKALGARKSVILMEFLLESAFLCIIGGLIGLSLVFILTKVVSAAFGFPLFLSASIISLALFICILAGIFAGIIPASRAAKMDPVVAIRSN